MSTILPRRGFLRGLTTLPLIGGGVTLIGQPTAVAEPITQALLTNYETWLNQELRNVSHEWGDGQGTMAVFDTPAWTWHRERFHKELPSTRAALVLSAVGVDWTRPAR